MVINKMFVATVMGLRNASVHAEANSIREYAPFWIEEELQFVLRFEDCSLIVNTHRLVFALGTLSIQCLVARMSVIIIL